MTVPATDASTNRLKIGIKFQFSAFFHSLELMFIDQAVARQCL